MKRIVILILCALLTYGGPSSAMTAEIGKVTATEGRVDVTRAPDNEAVSLVEGASVFVGDSIRAKDHSKAEIVFADKSVVKVAPNTRMEIKDFALRGGSRVHAEIHIARGKIFADVSKTGSPDTFVITTPNAKGSVRGTEVIVLYQAERTSALVKDGRLSISNIALPDQMKEIAGGEATMVPFDSMPEKPRPYMDAEFALHEQDTRPATFRAVSLGKGAGVMTGTITTLAGGVRILKKGAVDWHYAKLNEFVNEGDKVETAEDGMTSLMFDNGNIIQIQPGSRIMFSILKKDPKTGEFDNTFEVDSGKVKAVVEKIGKGSNFRVKTPTALCGVRGTVMYVNVAQGATQAFYEGGGGVVTNPVSGDTTFVESGQNAISTSTGAISAPVATSTEAMMTLDASYSYGVAADGYSSPENSAATTTKDGGATVPGVDNNAGVKTNMGTADVLIPADLVPITEANRPQPKPGVAIDDVTFSAVVGKVATSGSTPADTAIYSPETPTNSVTGQFTLSRSIDSTWITVGEGQVIGNVASSANIPGSYAFWIGDEVKCKTTNNGQYRGWLGASLSTTSSSTKPTFWSKALCLYRDPSGWAGTMTYDAAGKYVPSSKYFYSESNAFNSVVFTQREFLGSSYDLNAQTLESYDLYGRGNGYFYSGGSGTIACGTDANGSKKGLSGVTFNLPDKEWGIWQLLAHGTYSGTTSDNWSLALGGEHGSPSYWIGTMDGRASHGNIWDDRDSDRSNQLTAEFQGIFFDDSDPTPGKLVGGYILEGDVVGIANPTASPSKTWQAIGGGEYYVVYHDFSEASLGFTADELKSFVNVPISQVAASSTAIPSPPSGGFTAFNMDARVFDNGSATHIWTGIITGSFLQSSQPGAEWTVTLIGTEPKAASLTLSGGTWDATAKTWSATVVPGSTIDTYTVIKGQAGGTMTLNGDSSSITGIAAGTAT
jgi:hypothetical protein